MFNSVCMCDVNLHHVTYSVYQALLFPPPCEARASPHAGKRGTEDEIMSCCVGN